MSNSTGTIAKGANVTPSELGPIFVRWGLGVFILGFIVGFIPIVHYMHGAVAGDVGPAFMKNMTLWWGCPAVLSEYALKTGGLGMIVLGLCYIVFSRSGAVAHVSSKEVLAPKLCLWGLIATVVYAAVGYVVCNMIWPNFYFQHNEIGKDVWLAGQGIALIVYVVGLVYAFNGIRSRPVAV
jgi:hypothetical protein